ncbi:phosphatase PAP2 family protein [bacterium]|nr:phosphatase PAP2 family protein [bacterium]
MRIRIGHPPDLRRPPFGAGRRLAVSALALWMTGIPALRAGDGIQSAGDALRLVLPATAIGTALLQRDFQGAVQFIEAAALTGVVTEALKVIVDEKRPNGNRYSFPSGHTSISFCSAEFFRKRYGWRVGAPAYAASVFVGVSRVQARKHWIHDVAAGAAIGAAFGAWRTRSRERYRVEAFSGNGCAGIRICRDG